jgi:integrase
MTVDYEMQLSEPKTSQGRRVVALDPATVRALREHKARQLDERLAMGGEWGNELDLVFTHPDGTPIHPQTFSDAFERRVASAGLPKLSLHGLRHTHATLALRAGVHPKVVSERLGHASIAFTMDVCTDALSDLQEGAAWLVAALVFPAATSD